MVQIFEVQILIDFANKFASALGHNQIFFFQIPLDLQISLSIDLYKFCE